METRLFIAYVLIGLMVLSAFVAAVWLNGKRREKRDLMRGKRKRP